MKFKPENKKKGPGETRIDPLPCVSTIKAPQIPRRDALTVRSWPFLGSFALHAVLFEILFFPALQPPAVVISQAPAVLWFTPFIVPGDSGRLAEMLSQPTAAFAQETKTAEPVTDDRSEDTASNLPATNLAPTAATSDETRDKAANANSIIIQTPPKVRSKADRILPDPTVAPRQAMPLPIPDVSRNPPLPSSEPPREKQEASSAEQPGINHAEKEQSNRERIERQDEVDRLSQELALQKRVLVENARQEQEEREKLQQERRIQEEQDRLVAEKTHQALKAREQEQLALREQAERKHAAAEKARQALREQSERKRVATDKIRQEQEVRDKLQQESRIQKEQELLAAERARLVQKAREQEQQALREQAERKHAAAETARQEQVVQEKLQQERRIQEEQKRLAVERARQAQKAREQEQQVLREQTERKHAAAETARQEREAQEHLLRERKLQEEMWRRKRVEQTFEQPKREMLAAATKQQENFASKTPEKRTEQHPTQQPQKGLVLPLLKGDLKLVLAGASLPKITITFKEFTLSRRNRPFSRIEARHETIIAPLIANTQEKKREVVIEKIRPGVYTITVEPVAGSSDFTCLLKLHEGASGMSVRELGRHTLVRKKVLLKILMPDGILWDDGSSFTGSMENSDSVTKFNTETGLMWKEYSD